MDPSLEGVALDKAADQLRKDAVTMSMALVLTDEADMGEILPIMAPTPGGEVNPSRDDVVAQLSRFMEDGEYQGRLGDMMPQVMMK